LDKHSLEVKQTSSITFDDFLFDRVNQCVWRGAAKLSLTPKAFLVLNYLISNRARLVTKGEFLQQVWAGSFVSDAVLKVCVREIRKALEDDAATPRFIETVHRRGYRFIASIRLQDTEYSDNVPTPDSLLVGRDDANSKLRKWLKCALDGDRRVVFITGDPGAGKSTLSESFLRSLPEGVLVARGHALEQYGSGEPYMPILEALTALAGGAIGSKLVRLLETNAPTWLAQMPSLAASFGNAALQREVLGATRERMLREMAEAIEGLTADVPLVLLLEDLHWSDPSTLDLISYLARRRAPARLLLIGTYRPVEVALTQHPLKAVKQELHLHALCHELPLEFLTESSVREYLDRRFSPNTFDPALARLIHARTAGNPLFMVTAAEFLENRCVIAEREGRWQLVADFEQVEVEMPQNLRELIERQIYRLSPEEQLLLRIASVIGTKFSTAAISFTDEFDSTRSEEVCEALTRRGLFIRRCGLAQLPDGRLASEYEFLHSLYQNVCYDTIPMGKRLGLHRRIGEGGEAVYGARSFEIAAELALHFEEGRDYVRAAIHLFQAATNASRRHANREAVEYLQRACILIGRLNQTERVDLQLTALQQLGLARRSLGDMQQAAEDLGKAIALARSHHRFEIAVKTLLYQASVLSWLDRSACIKASEDAFSLSSQIQDRVLRAHARGYCSYWHLLFMGWREEDVVASREAVEAAELAGDLPLLSLHVGRHSYFQSLSSRYQEAVRTADRGIALAMDAGDFFDLTMTQFYKGWALLHSGRWDELLRLLQDAVSLAEKNEQYLWITLFKLEMAWLHEECGSFCEAQNLCELAFRYIEKTGHDLARMMAAILLGRAFIGQKKVDRGIRHLEETAAWIARDRVIMDWIWEIPLRLVLGDAYLSVRNFDRASENAERLVTIATQPGEQTYMALGNVLLADIAFGKQRHAAADKHIRAALDLVEQQDLPLAALRVYRTASLIRRVQNESAAAVEYARRETHVRERLLQLVESAPLLRDSLASSESRVLKNSGASAKL
jgi:DNA-binding winged helix-turn-helix (wHTH) protein/tetratricopeptide (TPR) repeat protein